MSRTSFILATAGHVDHGKSSLVRALTGTEPDRLPAERARGVTIELGFAHFAFSDIDVGVIDVPGHEDFVKNMVAGVGAIDVALLVVAADDGWMPQTEEHLQILTYLGVRHAVVALTKVDLVEDVSTVEKSIRHKLDDSPFATSTIVRTSTRHAFGLGALSAALASTFNGLPLRADVGKPRLAVDRAFSLRGIGTVVTGTLVGGSIGRGDALFVQPSGAVAYPRVVQTHGTEVQRATPGARVALSLPALKVGEARSPIGGGVVGRGDLVTSANVGVVTSCIDVLVERSARTTGGIAIASGLRVVVHHGTATVFATLRTADRASIAAGRRSLARLQLERPLLLMIGDRLLLRDSSQRATLAGAVVLDVTPPTSRRKAATETQRTLLVARAASLATDVVVASQVGRDGVVSIETIDRSVNASSATLLANIEAGIANGAWRRVGARLVAPAAWRAAVDAVAAAIDAHQVTHPEHAGASLTIARTTTAQNVDDQFFNAVIDELTTDRFERVGNVLRRRGHRASLPARLLPAGAAIQARLDARPFDPPSRREVAVDDQSVQALRFLIASQSVVEISADVVMTAAAYEAAAVIVRTRLAGGSSATVSELKQSLGSSRRVVVPLLECFDRDGITRRLGDRRETGPRAS